VASSAALTGYSTREVASILGVAEERVRYFVDQEIVDPARDAGGAFRFSFQDLVILRAAHGLLEARIPPRKVRQALALLPEQLPRGRNLSAVRITAEGSRIVVQEGDRIWDPLSGQRLLDFRVSELAEAAAPIASRLVRDADRAEEGATADDWFELGVELEASSPPDAEAAYRRCLELAPAHPDAHLNLGRIHHERGEIRLAEEHYRRVLEARADDAIAAFNLGVALEDRGRLEEAARSYEVAIGADAGHADARFNLAGVLESLGRKEDALRHLMEYRKLVGKGS
jgi:tetratricopeptide (TPR) repeat protein